MSFGGHGRTVWTFFAGITIVALTILIYVPGLHGPYLLDDVGNLESVRQWLEGNLSFRNVVLDNRSGPGGRPVSMVSFVFDAWRSGDMNSFAFKCTNLVIHLVNGALAWLLARLVFVRGGASPRSAVIAATLLAAAWLWMPIQVSTTLYVVQRMAQLAACFTFVALIVFMQARRAMIDGKAWGRWLLWIGTPLATGVAILAKENGALALPLAAVLEFTLFPSRTRTRDVRAFFVITVGLPCAAAVAIALFRPDIVTRGFVGRDFTVLERLLTEPRVLWSYLQTSFFPVGPRMGLYHDNFPLSTSLTAPVTTLVAVLAWAVLLGAAVVLRKRAPIFLAGLLGYLVGLSLESGPISLELYFEHRNYGPVFFALLAVAGVLIPAFDTLQLKPSVRRLCGGMALLILASYAFGTWNQAHVWSDSRTFNAAQYEYNPTSPRLLSNFAARAMLDGKLDDALAYIGATEANSPPSERGTSTLWRFLAYCESATPDALPPTLYGELDARASSRITSYGMVAWGLLADRLARGCGTIDRARIVASGKRWLEASTQPRTEQTMWRTRYNIARILADDGDLAAARQLADEAWHDSGKNNGIGVLLFQLNASLGDAEGCRIVLDELRKSAGGGNFRLDAAIRTFEQAMRSDIVAKPAPLN